MGFGDLSYLNKTFKKSKNSEITFGKEQEHKILDKLNTFFEDDIKLSKYDFETFDGQGLNNKYEIKSRLVNHNTYKTTIITRSKAKDNIIFIFNFLDKLAYIRYDEKQFKQYKTSDTYQRKPRYGEEKPPLQKIFYIPITDLKYI